MGPRGLTLPPAATTSAKAFRSAFYCDLCSKGYSRQNEYDAHESSYDHQHKKRLKEMKSMQKQAQAQQQPGTRGDKGPLVQIKLGGGQGGGKKGGFKKAGFKSAFAGVEGEEEARGEVKREAEEDEFGVGGMKGTVGKDEDSDFTDEEDYYDPRRPTGCMPECQSRVRAAVG